ncbi:prephenate dehydratase [bacterium]|nr:prephenate dehydratase [bacterium]
MDELKTMRSEIDSLDLEVARLLLKRMEYVVRIKRFKGERIEDQNRESEVIDAIKRVSYGLLDSNFTTEMYAQIMQESKRLQAQELTLCGFQGEHGAYSEIGVNSLGKSWVAVPCPEFADVFSGVESGAIDYGIIPVENSIAGEVAGATDLLVHTNLQIVCEVVVQVNHALMCLPGTDHREIRTVYSHPQALAQCKNFLSRNKLEAEAFYDTAGSAMMLRQKSLKGTACIASILAGKLYGLEVIKEGIQDDNPNETRMLVVSKQPSAVPGNKCTIVFGTKDESGALFKALKAFSENNINLTRIESRPNRSNPGTVLFLLDFMGNNQDGAVAKTLEQVKSMSTTYRFLGCYTSAR